MYLLDLAENLITIVLFSLICAVFGWALHYLFKSIEYYKQIKSNTASDNIPGVIRDEEKKPVTSFKFTWPKLKTEKSITPKPVVNPEPVVQAKKQPEITVKPPSIPKPEMPTEDVKEAIIHQQEYFNALVKQMQENEEQTKRSLNKAGQEWEEKIEQLELKLEDKEEELIQLKKQKELTEKMGSRLAEVQNEFNLLKDKITGLEVQASRSNHLAMELEDLKIAYHELKKDGSRRQEKIQELLSENGRLQQLLADTEDKLHEANMQRQQMQKKISFLEEMNADFTRVTEANKKLQNEMRRIGELESLLNMITEERDQLLKSRY